MTKDKTSEYVTVTGQYMRTLMRDYQSGYTVFKILTKNEGMITCTGCIILPSLNMKVDVTGYWTDNSKYGRQLSDCTIHEVYSDKDGMIEYLCGVPGVGKSIATYLVDTYGEQLYNIALSHNAVTVLSSAPGISKKRIQDIISYIKGTEEQRRLFNFLRAHGGNYVASAKIYKEFGVLSMSKLYENPYSVGYQAGLGFHVCDSIARSINFLAYSSIRIGAAVKHLLKNQTVLGNTYAPLSDLVSSAREFLGYSKEYEAVSSAILNGYVADGLDGCVVEKDNDASNVFLRSVYYNEVHTAYAIRRLMKTAIKTDCDPEELCEYAENVCGVPYAEQQREAFKLLCSGGVGIITGGPGTGKTTVIKGLLAAYEKLYPQKVIKLCAPTGRASQRMKEATGKEATTIHRLLEYKPYGDVVAYKNEADPIEADFLFVDEGSMISIDVADMLFSAIKSGTMVIIAGDVDQLPSVGAGNVLSDLIESGVVPVVALTKTYRQAEGSLIISNAHKIRDGNTKLDSGNDFEILVCDDETMPDLIEEQFLKYNKSNNVFGAQILVPSRKRGTGTKAINKRIQAAVNPSEKGISYADSTFRIGDKVMLMRNNYLSDDAYYNGDVGIVTGVDSSGLEILVDGQVIRVDESQLDDVSLAYACTIHKSQGSEYDVAICVMPSEPANMLQRNLLYTAVTRAKKKVVLIASPGSVEKAIYTRDVAKRKSKLVARLQGRTLTKES